MKCLLQMLQNAELADLCEGVEVLCKRQHEQPRHIKVSGHGDVLNTDEVDAQAKVGAVGRS